MPRRLKLPRSNAIRPHFTPQMAAQAFGAARLPFTATEPELGVACQDVCFGLHYLLTALDDHRGQLQRVHGALLRIADGNLGYLASLTRSHSAQADQSSISWLHDSTTPMWNDPVVAALRSGLDYIEWMVGQSFEPPGDISTAESTLRTAATLAAKSLADGISRAEAEYLSRSRQRAEQFAWALIEFYVRISGRPARFSRKPATALVENEPTGPLIRFLEVAYAQLCEAIADDRSAQLPAEMLSPARETLADWIRGYRRRLAQ